MVQFETQILISFFIKLKKLPKFILSLKIPLN